MAVPAELTVLADRTATVEASVELRNDGSVPVEIREVRASCHCMAPSPTWQRQLQPGESTVVTFGAHPMSYGVRRASLTIITDSAIQPAISVPIEIKGPPLEPPYVRWAPSELHQRVEPGATEATLPFAITCVESKQEAPWFLGCESALESVSFSPPEVTEEKVLDDETVLREYQVTATVAVATGEERLSGMVKLNLASASMRPAPEISLHISNEPPLRCIPAALVVRTVPDSYTIVLRSDEGVPFQVLRATADDAAVTAEFEQDRQDHTQVLHVTVASAGVRSAHLDIVTTHPKCEHVPLTIVWDTASIAGNSTDE